MRIASIDHLVLTVRDLERTCDFYARAMGMAVHRFHDGRLALHFGRQKINLHLAGAEFEPKAETPVPGSADLCFLLDGTVDEAAAHLAKEGVDIIEGPVERVGAVGTLRSVYFRDPDGNLVEVSEQI
jgi:catechol 2,3-dioxygenase-like lactoylglutathione lyase family enzyme